MRTLYQDLTFGTRVLLSCKGFTAAAVLTLALGIAAVTTVFGWIDTFLVRPLPGVSDSDRLVVLEIATTGWNSGAVNASHNDYRFARENLRSVSGIAAHTLSAFNLGDGRSAQRTWGEAVSGNYFAVVGVKPLLGRVFQPEEYGDKPGGYPVVVISERLWRSRFSADTGVIGKTAMLKGCKLLVQRKMRSFRGLGRFT